MQKNVRPINTMFKNKLFLLLVFFAMTRVHAQEGIGVFEGNLDIGTVRHNGAVFYDSNTQKYVVRASGANMWGDTDNFHYLWRSIQGDFIIRAQVEFLGPGVNEHRKLGLTVRNGLHSGAAMVNATVHGGDGLTSLQYRLADDDETKEVQSADNAPTVIQLERRGNLFIMSTATFGVPLTSVQQEVSLNNEVYVGLSLCSHDADVVETAIFKNVRIIKPVKEDYVAYSDYLGSRLEIMDVITGDRKVLLNSAHSIQAPNWSVDGKLIYNSNGMLYTYDQQNGKVEMIQTGFATRNNNDHVLSFDGKYLGISHHDGEDNGDS
ncbi:MAG: biopolymer transporter TolR, partial [Allomuricauda sp.]